jgi:transcriptional regulator GlxA family with amidase domain
MSIERVKQVLDYVEQRYYEPHNLSGTSRMAYLSQRQFTNLCRKLKGKSFIEYVNTIRVQKAKELLVNTDMPVSAVAFEVGFEEISTFYRAFRKYYRRPPLSFRS